MNIYFGKIIKMQMLRTILSIYLNLLKNKNVTLDTYEKEFEKYNNSIITDDFILIKYLINDIKNNRKCFYNYNNEKLDKCKNLIEKTLEYIFGINKVYLYIIKEDDLNYSIFNSEIYGFPYYQKRLENYLSNRIICYNYFDNDKEYIFDNFEKQLYIKNIKKYINISLENGIYFDKNKYSFSVILLLPEKIENFYFTIDEWISIILHEFGHVFAYILFDINKLDYRINEIFADKFVSLYGYGSEFINSRRKELSMRIWLKYNNKIKNIIKFNEIKYSPCIDLYGIKRQEYIHINTHPCILNRSENILKQIQFEAKNNKSKEYLKKVNKEIKKIKKSIYLLKNNPYYIPNTDIKCKLYIKEKYNEYINNYHLDKIERFCNKLYKLDKRLFKEKLKILYTND